MTDFFQPNRKYPRAAPRTTARQSHVLYVMKISISRKLNVTCRMCSSVWNRCISDSIVGLE